MLKYLEKEENKQNVKKNIKLSKICDLWTDDNKNDDESRIQCFSSPVLFAKNESLKTGALILNGTRKCLLIEKV